MTHRVISVRSNSLDSIYFLCDLYGIGHPVTPRTSQPFYPETCSVGFRSSHLSFPAILLSKKASWDHLVGFRPLLSMKRWGTRELFRERLPRHSDLH